MEQQQGNLFSAEDFERYYNGRMTAAEMHALEKAALDDPFLSDALEGYAYTATPVKDTELLKAVVQKKSGKRKIVSGVINRYSLVKAAAMVLIVAGLGWAVYRLAIPTGKAVAKQEELKLQSVMPDSVRFDSGTSFLTGDTLVRNSPVAKQYHLQTREKPSDEKEPDSKINGLIIGNEDRPGSSKKESVADGDRDIAEQSQSIPAAAALQKTNFFKGRVFDKQYNPLPFASVKTDKDSVVTQTDINGNFSIAVPDTVLNGTVSLMGYEGATLHLNKADTGATVILQETAIPLSEVVVTGTRQKKSPEKVTARSETLEPAEGWSSFDDYIARNLKVPDDVQKKRLSGYVVLSFEVNSTGEPVNIKVEKSLCATCDKEAIRLLQNGPAWRKKGGKKGIARFRF